MRNCFLKLVSTIFYQIFSHHQMIALQKLWKFFLFHLKSSFRSRDIQVFVFSSSPLFLPVSLCFSCWSKKNLKVYYAINSVSKNWITHFVRYLKKEIGCDIEYQTRNIFMENSCRKCAPKLVPDPFSILQYKLKQLLQARNSFKSKIFSDFLLNMGLICQLKI